MNYRLLSTTLLAGSLLSISSQASAVTDAEFQALKRQLNQMADLLEKTPQADSATHIGGYGELHYNNLESPAGKSKDIDFHRFVLEISHDFSSDVRLITEVELEHALVEDTAGGTGPGELELEQAYVQIDLSDTSTFNAGVFLIPVGILNESHEPATFYGVERNPVEKNILPATWWEAGAMYSANSGESGLSYDFAIHSGLNGGVDIRGGRQKAAEADASNLATTARIKYTGSAGLELAATVQYQTDMTQDTTDTIDAGLLLETHAVYNAGPFTAKILYAQWDISGSGAGNQDKQSGYYVEGDYKLSPKMGLFVRQNGWDNGGPGITGNKQTDLGMNYWVHEDVVFKFDFQFQNDVAGDNDGFNVGVGYQF